MRNLNTYTLIFSWVTLFVAQVAARAQGEKVGCGRSLSYTNEEVLSSDPLVGFYWGPGREGKSFLVYYFTRHKGVVKRGKARRAKQVLCSKRVVIPLSCPGAWFRIGKRKELVFSGWNINGGGVVLSLVLDLPSARISWIAKFRRRIYSMAWWAGKKKILLLAEDGTILVAQYTKGGILEARDFTELRWRGEAPWDKLGGVPNARLFVGSWKGWPFGKEGELVACRRTGRGVTPRKFFIIKVMGKECWVKGVWENPFYHPLKFRDPFPVVGDEGLWVQGGKGETVQVVAFPPGGKASFFRGKVGKSGCGWIQINGGLKFGWVYLLKGAPWHVDVSPYRAASPLKISGIPFSSVRGMKPPEIHFPRPILLYAGADTVWFEVSVETGKEFPMGGLDWYFLAAPQQLQGKAPLYHFVGDKVVVLPWAVGRLDPGKWWMGEYTGKLPLPDVPKLKEGIVIWVQAIIVKPGSGIVAASRALGFCVLKSPNYKESEFTRKYGRIDIFMGNKPPRPVTPRTGQESVRGFKEWMAQAKGIKNFRDPGEGRRWIERFCFKKGRK